MIELALADAHTWLGSTLCSACPQGVTGCCTSPPDLDWSDIGRIVSLGGRDFLLEQIKAKNLLPTSRGLAPRRVKRRTSSSEQKRARCVFHGPSGCTIPKERRPATCNYFLCEDAFTEGGEAKGDPNAEAARRAHTALRKAYSAWDQELGERVRAYQAREAEGDADGVTRTPGALRWDSALLDWLGDAFEELRTRAPGELHNLTRPSGSPRSAPLW